MAALPTARLGHPNPRERLRDSVSQRTRRRTPSPHGADDRGGAAHWPAARPGQCVVQPGANKQPTIKEARAASAVKRAKLKALAFGRIAAECPALDAASRARDGRHLGAGGKAAVRFGVAAGADTCEAMVRGPMF